MKIKIIFALCLLPMMSMAQKSPAGASIRYPETRKSNQRDTLHGVVVEDPYRWLEDDLSAETADWVDRQNKVTNNYLAQIPYRNSIKERLTKLWNYEKYSAPFVRGAYTYFYKNDGLQNQSVLYRQVEGGKPEVFLDPNQFSASGTTSLAGISFTEDGSLCAYQISEGGSDWRKVLVMDVESRKLLGDTLFDVKFSGLSWKGNEGFYYSSYDKPLAGSALSAKTQQHKLYYHKLESPQKSDQLVFGGDQQPRRYVGGFVTEDQQFLVVTAANATYGNELYVQRLGREGEAMMVIADDMKHEHDVVHSEGEWIYILTNLDAPNRRLVRARAESPTTDSWETLIPETKYPLTVSQAGGFFFCQYLRDAVSQVIQCDMEGNQIREIELPSIGTASGFDGRRNDKTLYYSFTSYIFPPTIFQYAINEGKSSVYKKSGVDFDPSLYESHQVFYNSKDGTRVPMIITHKKGLKRDGTNPTLLYGYGGFNISLTPSFSTSNIILLEKGGIYAVANLRGGGEYGDAWHDAGTQMRKQNVFDDFIAAGEFLIKEGYTNSKKLAIAGGSNGGLLVGACMTQRPDLFRVCCPAVGVLDMLRYHVFTAGAGWAYDYGKADDGPDMFRYLLGYSPVHNVKKGTAYPATMIMTADHDDRVVPAHSFKFAAALQAGHTGPNPVLIRIETKAGHGAGKPTSMIIDEQADKWSFMFFQMDGK
jgi:prolyl oligopeptidase